MPVSFFGLFVSTRIVRQPEIREDLIADCIVARVGREAELGVGLDGVEALLLELVGAQLVEQADAASFLSHVEQHCGPRG